MGVFSRRGFLKSSGLSAAGVMLGDMKGFSEYKSESTSKESWIEPSYDIMKELMKFPKIDAYANALTDPKLAKAQIDYADRLGIDKLFISVPIAVKMGKTPDEFRAYNNLVLQAMKRYPNRLIGQVTIHPAYLKESLEEIKRCIDAGMVGMKLYNQVKINDSLFYPLIEKYLEYNMIIHVHGESQLGVGGYRMEYDVKNTPTISRPEDFIDMAKRYPEAMFQYAHIGGGSDWEYACKSFKNYSNIYVDTGGSNNEENMIDFAVQNLGEDRVFFGCDNSFYQAGKILASNLNDAQKQKVFFKNYNNVLRKSGNSFK